MNEKFKNSCHNIKSFIKKIFPALIPVYRFCKYMFVAKDYCPFCRKRTPMLPGGRPIPRRRAMCAYCHSLERHRFLFYLYRGLFLAGNSPISLLQFAPEEPIHSLMSHYRNIKYICGDLHPENLRDFAPDCRKLDAENTGLPDESFDYILANQVVEHVDEARFLAEMLRILKPGGMLLINAPIYTDLEFTVENPTIKTPNLRLKEYGHPAHLRKYGRDIVERLSKGFSGTRYIRYDAFPPFGDKVNSNCIILIK